MPVILVVDDSATERARMAGLIGSASDHEVIAAESAADAIQVLGKTPVDVVLTDLQMPGSNGLELLESIRKDHPLVPVILVTSAGSEEIAVEALRNGAAAYIAKTSMARRLKETLERVLQSRSDELAQAELMGDLQNDEYELVLENDRLVMSATARFLRQTAESVGICPPRDAVRMGVALEEALLNACLHGNLELDSALRELDGDRYYSLGEERARCSPFRQRRVRVNARFSPSEACIRIQDEGPGFDPGKLPDPTDPENLLRPHGRGVLMIRMFMDDVRWNQQGNEITLVKRAEASAD